MLRVLRAFAWLRWRILVNSLERSTSRDLVQRFSLGIEQLSPVLLALLMIPSALALAAAGAVAGWDLASGDPTSRAFGLVRAALAGALMFACLGPLILRGGGQLPAVRMLLLPVPRTLLYIAQAGAALADPWVVLAGAALAGLPLGLAAGGAPGSAVVALMAGVLFVAVLAGATGTVSAVLQFAVRSRRRAELLGLAGVLALVLLPWMLHGASARMQAARFEQREAVRGAALAAHAWRLLPTAWYADGLAGALQRSVGTAITALGVLAAMAGVLHAAAFSLFVHLWRSPGLSGASTRTRSVAHRWRIPGASPAMAAVATNQVRLAFRTPRGRAILLIPLVIVAAFALLLMRNPAGAELGMLRVGGGIGLAVLGSAVSLLAILPFAMNQFAIDRAGLTLLLLIPLETRALLAGKAAGNLIVSVIPAALCTGVAYLLFPAGDAALWLSVPLAFAATYLLASPAAAVLSMIFPRPVDLTSAGSGSNAHGAATLLGMLCMGAAALPCLVVALLAIVVLGRPIFAPVFLLLWCVSCAAICLALLRTAEPLFERRKENLALTA